MKKTLAFILAMLICLSAMVSCGGKSDTADTTTTTATTPNSQASTTEVTTTEAETAKYPDFGGNKQITILYWDDVARPEFDVPEQTGDLIGDAIYNRNAAVEERLGLDLNWVGTPGSYSVQADYIAKASADVQSGGEFDVFAAYSMSAVTMTLQGLFRDLLPAEYLDFEQPWWPATLLENSSVNGKLYFCSGDISTNVLNQMAITLFNKNMAKEMNLPNLYEIVDKGQWTVDKMAELASTAYSDVNGNTTADVNDRFGIGLRKNIMFDAFFVGANLHSLERDANGTMIISAEFTSEKTHDLLTKLVKLFHESNYTAFPATVEGWNNAPFANGQVLFIMDLANVTTSTELANTSVTYGVLPVPKYDEAQERHLTSLEYGYTMYGASIVVNDEDRNAIGALLECMADESYHKVIPAVFETTMKLKYSSGEDDARMYDIIRNGISFDLGRLFAEPLEKITYFAFREAANNGTTNWASFTKAKTKIMQKQLDTLTQKLAELPE